VYAAAEQGTGGRPPGGQGGWHPVSGIITRVVGIDSSLTATGLAVTWPPRSGSRADAPLTISEHTGRKGKINEPLTMRRDRLRAVVAEALGMVNVPSTLVVIEAPAHGAKGGSAHDRAGLWWMLVDAAMARDLPVVEVGNASRQLWTAGKGGADKASCAAALSRKYGVDADCDNCYDAAGLALMGAHALGWIDGPQYATDTIDRITWPDDVRTTP
jgi:Holliday junction resolvasome RuvABC endonuclease subunit